MTYKGKNVEESPVIPVKEYVVYERMWWEPWLLPVCVIAMFIFAGVGLYAQLENIRLRTENDMLRSQQMGISASLSADQSMEVNITNLDEITALTSEVNQLVDALSDGSFGLEAGVMFNFRGMNLVFVPSTYVNGSTIAFEDQCQVGNGQTSGNCAIAGWVFEDMIVVDTFDFAPDSALAEATDEVLEEATAELVEATEEEEATEAVVESFATEAASQTNTPPTVVTRATLVPSLTPFPTDTPTPTDTETQAPIVVSPTFVPTDTAVAYVPNNPLCPEGITAEGEPDPGYFEEWVEGIFDTGETTGGGCLRITSLNNEVDGYEFGFQVFGLRNRNSRWQWINGSYQNVPGNEILAYTYAPDTHDLDGGGYYLVAFGTEPRNNTININVVVISARTGRVQGSPGFSNMNVGEYHFHIEEGSGNTSIYLRHNGGGSEVFTNINGSPESSFNWTVGEWEQPG